MALRLGCVMVMKLMIVFVALEGRGSNATYVKQPSQSSFCKRAEATRQCPNPPTVDSDFKIEKYLGKWYEIGSTAAFKLLFEPGLVCDRALYSSADGKLSLRNSGLRVISRLAAAEVTAINVAARGSCTAAREVCYQLPALMELSQSLSDSSLRYRLASSVQAAGLALDRLAADVTLVQQANGDISQANYSPGGRTLQSSVDVINRFTKDAEEQRNTIANFAAELNNIRSEATKESEQAQKTLGSAAVKIGASSAGIGVALKALEVGAKSLLSNGQPVGDGSVSSVMGTIAQPSATSPAKLQVTINVAKSPYWIIALEKAKDGSYSAALVYSCQQGGKSLFVLSREPTLEMTTLDAFLSTAESLGIYNDCEDPFILTLQRGGSCGEPPNSM
ncbi:hypothetical protein KP509_39G013700 [Ceratopteris richardii]|uniref:Lipocalin/cytosolic fatty-acid binding domain-containing protein n=1 Tax=Ceratopteris richardii TaxID=49495 RepID=A0A8T2PYW4_CERRI|nr:hypothetical protein KP509_39G013700 [Ceratopteris richardii]